MTINPQWVVRNIFKKDELGLEIAKIALPATLALAADPVASLIDTAFIGHIGLFLLYPSFSQKAAACLILIDLNDNVVRYGYETW